MKATILETAMEIADHLLSDIDNKISTNWVVIENTHEAYVDSVLPTVWGIERFANHEKSLKQILN